MTHDVSEPLVTVAVNGYKNPELLRLCLSTLYREFAHVPYLRQAPTVCTPAARSCASL